MYFQAPDYHQVIKRPMDFGTIQRKLFDVAYAQPQQCLADIRLVFTNCAQYNDPSTPHAQAGRKLSAVFERRVTELELEEKVRHLSAAQTSSKTSTGGRKR